jgi:cell wall-associated NlpC family hydrolase
MNAPELAFVAHPVADLFQAVGGPRDRQLRYGEGVTITSRRDGFAFGQSPDAGHRGWLLEAAVLPEVERSAPTHWVSARQTHAYAEPDFKAPERAALPHLSKLAVSGQDGRFSQTEIGWVPTAHLSDAKARDPVSVAELYLGAPYLWGGNSIWGLDCSGLVHAALIACGHACPSDSGEQEAELGKALPPDTAPKRGDLLFWTGHVAWVVNAETLLHANVHHMAVAHEPLQVAIARIEAQGDGPVTAHKRLGGWDER